MKEAVCVLIEHPVNGRVLCVSRRDNLLDWGLPGGKVEWGESLVQAAVRELREETGIHATDSELELVFQYPCKGEVSYYCYCFRMKDPRLASYIFEMKCHRSSDEGQVEWRTWIDLTSDSASFKDYNRELMFQLSEHQ